MSTDFITLEEKSIVRMDKKSKKKTKISKASMNIAKSKDPATYAKMIKHYKIFKMLKSKLMKKYASKGKAAAMRR